MGKPVAGVGIGLRADMAKAFLETLPPEAAWVEVHPENYIRRGGTYAANLLAAREHYPVVTHGLTMGFGTPGPFDRQYLGELAAFLRRIGTPWHSDHLCFCGIDGAYVHDLLPLPFTDEAAKIAAARIVEMRDAIDRPVAIENVSYYAAQSENALDEAAFVVEVLERTDASLLLDVNNVFVNSRNFDFDPRKYIDKIPAERVVQLHVAGHFLRDDGLRIDTHGEPIPDGVYELLDYTLRRIGPKPLLLERDNNIPPLEELLGELRRLRTIYDRATVDARPAQGAAE